MNKDLAAQLYFFEFQFLSGVFFDEERDLFSTLAEKPETNFAIFSAMCRDREIDCPFTAQDFSARVFRMDDAWYGTLINFPEPPEPPFAFQMFLFMDSEGKQKGCYTLEFGTRLSDETKEPEFCGWLCSTDEKGNHLNHGSCPIDGKTDYFAEAFNFHKQRMQALAEQN